MKDRKIKPIKDNLIQTDLPEIKLGKYRHYKGKEYEVIGIAYHSESLEQFVVYCALYGDGRLWIRPYGMFLEEILVEGQKKMRFQYLGD